MTFPPPETIMIRSRFSAAVQIHRRWFHCRRPCCRGFVFAAVQLPSQVQCQLCAFDRRRRFKGRVQPCHEITVDKQLVPQQGNEVGQGPAEGRNQLQVSQQQHGDESRPDLRLHCIGAGPQKRFDLEVLLQRLEEQFHLPAVLIDRCDRRRAKLQVVGQEDDAFLLLFVPDFHQTEVVLVAFLGLTWEIDHLVLEDVAVRRHSPLFHNLVNRVVLQPGHEVHTLPRQADKPLVVDIAPVYDQHRAGIETHLAGYGDVARLSCRDDGKRRQVPLVIEQKVQLDRSLRPTELCPVVERQTQIHHACIQAHQLVLEAEFLPAARLGNRRLALPQQLVKDCLKHLPRAMFVRVGQRGSLRRSLYSKMLQLPFATGQSATDLPQSVSSSELAEQHRHELPPAHEASAVTFRLMRFDGLLKLESREQLQQLRENATKSLHGWSSLGRIVSAKKNLTHQRPNTLPSFFRDPDVDKVSAQALSNAAAVPKYAIS